LLSKVPAAMADLLVSGRVFDGVLAVIALELFGFLGYGLIRRDAAVNDVCANLLAAAGLLGAARLVLAGAWWGFACLLLIGALLAHLLALRARGFQGARRSAPSALSRPPVST